MGLYGDRQYLYLQKLSFSGAAVPGYINENPRAKLLAVANNSEKDLPIGVPLDIEKIDCYRPVSVLK
jgi:hypothetical protein